MLAVCKGIEKERKNEHYYQSVLRRIQDKNDTSGNEKNLRSIPAADDTSGGSNTQLKQLGMFHSYSHDDIALKEELDKQLTALKRSYNVAIWQDKDIEGGHEWDETIREELQKADIVLLLISSGFIGSEYIWNVELKTAIEKHERGEAKVIPIFLRRVFIKGQPYEKLQEYLSPDKPIGSFPENEREDAIYTIVENISHNIESLLKTKSFAGLQ